MIEDLRRDPAQPVYWGGNQKGMQAAEELEGVGLQLVQSAWEGGMEDAIKWVEMMVKAGLHKQIANRMLEPWAHINVVCTASEYENFYKLRRHKDAQPEMKALADAMYDAQLASEPELKLVGEWHLPYIREEEKTYPLEEQKMVSVARCARVSYLTFDGRETSFEEDEELYNRLVGSQPLHASPAEHQATPLVNINNNSSGYAEPVWRGQHLQGNLRGWMQLRKTLPGEFTPG
jgi:thymidylate synthase ThyX